ncbi:MAG: class I adenylate-forming enzyme family protein, partial [Chloroflexota bacterium]
MVTYADRFWTKSYDPHVPGTLAPYPDVPLHHFLKKAAKETPNQIALVTSTRLPSMLGKLGRMDTRITYAELDRMSDALAAAFVDMGLQKGDRVGLVMPNIAAYVISFWAVLKAGGAIAAINPTYPPEKIKFMLADSDAKLVVTMSMFYENVKKTQAETGVKNIVVTNVKEYLPGLPKVLFTLTREKKDGHYVESLPDSDFWLQDLLGKYQGQSPSVDVTGEDLGVFQYTGGTTGDPKAAMSKHGAMVANALQCEIYLKGTTTDSFLGAIPMFHVFGMLSVLAFATILKTPI